MKLLNVTTVLLTAVLVGGSDKRKQNFVSTKIATFTLRYRTRHSEWEITAAERLESMLVTSPLVQFLFNVHWPNTQALAKGQESMISVYDFSLGHMKFYVV